jgi:S1-C subfamily serine protease
MVSNKMNVSLVVMLVVGLVLSGGGSPTVAASALTIVLRVDSTRMEVDGRVVLLDAAPVIVEGRTLLPIRPVVEALEGEITWDAASQMVTIVKGTTRIRMQIGNSTAMVNDAVTMIDPANSRVTPRIIKSRTMLPLRFVASALGGEVMWDPVERKVTLNFEPTKEPLLSPSLRSPVEGAVLDAATTTFSWGAVQGAETYVLKVLAAGGSIAYQASSLTATSHMMPAGTLLDGAYSWIVTARSASGKSAVSSERAFVVRRELSLNELALLRRAVVYVEVAGYKDGSSFSSSGSGFFISTDGRIVTNYHVIDGATSGTVKLEDGRTFTIASVLGYSKATDLAIIAVVGSGFPILSVGQSDLVAVGDEVVAIGSPLGVFRNTVSDGIISKVWLDAIQTTAATSHGSSGGPLINRYGEVVGVIYAGADAAENIAVAKPSNEIRKISTANLWTLEQVYQMEHGNDPRFLPAAQLLSPLSGSTVSTTPTLSWTPVPTATKYWIEVWGGSTLVERSPSTTKYASAVYGTSFTVPTGLLDGSTTYAWAVWTYGPNDPPGVTLNNISTVWSFETVVQATLGAPTLLSPSDPPTVLMDYNSHVFQWSAVSGATSYEIRFVSSLGYLVLADTIYTGTTYTLIAGRLTGGAVYSWSVTAKNGLTSGTPSVSRRFGLAKRVMFTNPAYDGATVSPWSPGSALFTWDVTLGADSYEFNFQVLPSKTVVYWTTSAIPYVTVSSSYFVRGGSYQAFEYAHSGQYVVAVAMVSFQISW